MWSVVIVLFGIISIQFDLAYACNGYKLKLNYVKNCVDDSVVKIGDDFDVKMDKDCYITIEGCLNFTKEVKSATGKYTLKKAPMPPLSGEIDLCQIVEEKRIPQITEAIKVLGIEPAKCPVASKMACGSTTEKVSIVVFKNQIGLAAGKTDITLDLKHDEGVTCVKFSFDIHK